MVCVAGEGAAGEPGDEGQTAGGRAGEERGQSPPYHTPAGGRAQVRVVPLDRPRKGKTAISAQFFHFSSEYLKRLQSSEPLHTKKFCNHPTC
jgi:hypothetical protein